jgi:hypothetical protein
LPAAGPATHQLCAHRIFIEGDHPVIVRHGTQPSKPMRNRDGVEGLSTRRLSEAQLRVLVPALASYDGAAELERFLDLLLPGLPATLAGRDGQPVTVDDG